MKDDWLEGHIILHSLMFDFIQENNTLWKKQMRHKVITQDTQQPLLVFINIIFCYFFHCIAIKGSVYSTQEGT